MKKREGRAELGARRILSELGASIERCEGNVTEDGMFVTCKVTGDYPLKIEVTTKKGIPNLLIKYDSPFHVVR